METFDLSRLTDFDFEAVCKDLFEEELGERLEIFTSGADGGVDLRHLRSSGESLIIQCKHWHRSSRAKLVEHIKKFESEKVNKLKPSRYILATSLALSKDSKDKIFSALTPHMKTPSDIYGLDELNSLLRKHEHVVRRHLRLWLTSASVLTSLLSKSVVTRSQGLSVELNETLRTYADNPSFSRALDLLEGTQVCVIAGNPGIGKTTLAHVLCSHYLSLGYELIEISEDAEEANKLWDDSLKQIFYYDDFLGQTTLEEKLGKNEDGRLLSLMRRISKDPTKRFILTTREYILAQARERYERLSRHPFDMYTCVINLSDYTRSARARILYNHVYSSPLSSDIKRKFASPQVYIRIIEHKNFNPRIIAATLAEAHFLSDAPEHVADEVIRNLDEPHRVWEHIVNNQLDEVDVRLLMVMLSLRDPVPLRDLQRLWASYGWSSRSLRRSLAILEGTMLRSFDNETLFGPAGDIQISFHNPSVRDYLVTRASSDTDELKLFIKLVRTFEQFESLWTYFSTNRKSDLLSTFKYLRTEVESAAAIASNAEPFRSTPSIEEDGIVRAVFFFSMARRLESPSIRELGFLLTAENIDDVQIASEPDIIAIMSELANEKSPKGRDLLSEVKALAIERALSGDVDDWDRIEEAEEFLTSIESVAAGVDTEAALSALNLRRQDYATDAFDDWADPNSTHRIGKTEMEAIIEYYEIAGRLDIFESHQSAVQQLAKTGVDYTQVISRGIHINVNSRPDRVAEMMQTLGDEVPNQPPERHS